MKKKVIRFFRRLRLRFYLWTKKGRIMPTYQDETTPYEKTCFMICLKVIKHPTTKFMIAPMSSKRYMENKELDIFITMDYNRIDLTNHVYHYSVKLSNRDWERVIQIFDMETEKRRLNYEESVNSQIKNSLHSVLERISNFDNNTIDQ
jgi:hypothetical protein